MKDFGIHVQLNADATYSVAVWFRPIFEDMFEKAVHVARFKTELEARKLALRVKEAFLNRTDKSGGVMQSVDRRFWQGPTSICSPVRWDAEVDAYCVLPQKRAA
jgi:hypothetical protein